MQRDENTLQLRVGRFIPMRLYSRVKKRAAIFASLSCLTAVLSLFGVISYHVKREIGLKDRFARIVQLSNVDIDRFPFLEKTFVGKEEISKGIYELVKGLKNVKTENMLSSPPILVHQTFEWLYPFLGSEIEVRKVHYELLSYPSLEDPNKEFIIKYVLMFKPTSEQTAHLFYDKLVRTGTKFIETHFLGQEGDEYVANFTLRMKESL